MLIGELFGTSGHHKFVKSISSSGKFIYIDFYKYYYGVEFVASIKYNKIIPDCQSWLDDNILMSPNNSNINCSWIITREFGSYITLYFNYIEVKPTNITNKKFTYYSISIRGCASNRRHIIIEYHKIISIFCVFYHKRYSHMKPH